VTDEEYLERLGSAYRFPLHGFHPEMLVYVAGADPYYEDQLGGLSLTLEGLQRRDRLVIETALREGTAVAIVLAGGYAVHVEDTVTIHCNTAKVAKEALEAAGWVKK
jgi:acetoin utilization deacetylase AcuC-like enzyme